MFGRRYAELVIVIIVFMVTGLAVVAAVVVVLLLLRVVISIVYDYQVFVISYVQQKQQY